VESWLTLTCAKLHDHQEHPVLLKDLVQLYDVLVIERPEDLHTLTHEETDTA
jgi:hypothetical protein